MPFKNRSKTNHRRQLLKRHGKSKFFEGEVVLCYEPDPAKTKVLYSSKVMQIVEKYDDNDKRYEEYLIHFHGWNSTWDRYVTEDFILKDTPENRRLQQELANEAQLTPGGNLYKRDMRARRRGSSSRHKAKNIEGGGQSGNTSRSNEGAASAVETTQEEYSSEKSSDDEGMCISIKELPQLPVIQIPAILKKMLGYDEYLVKDKSKLLSLPSQPSIVTILELFVHHYVTNGLQSYIAKETRRLKYEDLVARVNLCKEIVDGFRIIFDFSIENLLLYNEEKAQFNEAQQVSLSPPVRCVRSFVMNEVTSENENNVRTPEVATALVENKVVTAAKRVLRSQHQPTPASEMNDTPLLNQTEKIVEKSECNANHKKEETYNSLPSSSCSSNGIAPLGSLPLDGYIILNSHIKKLVSKEMNDWKLILDSMYCCKPTKPSIIYGATHLARLFVRLPDILLYSQHKPDRIKMIVEYSEILLVFLSEHLEWFGDDHYFASNAHQTHS